MAIHKNTQAEVKAKRLRIPDEMTFPVRDADFKSPLSELAQIARLIAREAERYNLHYGAEMVSCTLNLAPSTLRIKMNDDGSYHRQISMSGISWRNL